jgi:hypothetical protein
MGNLNIGKNRIKNIDENIEEQTENFFDIDNKQKFLKIIDNKKKALSLVGRYYFDDRIIDNMIKIKEKFEEIGVEREYKINFNDLVFDSDVISKDENTYNKIPVTQEFDSRICVGKFTYHYNIIGGYNKYFWSCCGNEEKNHNPFISHNLEIAIFLEALNDQIINKL